MTYYLEAVKESMPYLFPRDRAEVMLRGHSKPLQLKKKYKKIKELSLLLKKLQKG